MRGSPHLFHVQLVVPRVAHWVKPAQELGGGHFGPAASLMLESGVGRDRQCPRNSQLCFFKFLGGGCISQELQHLQKFLCSYLATPIPVQGPARGSALAEIAKAGCVETAPVPALGAWEPDGHMPPGGGA